MKEYFVYTHDLNELKTNLNVVYEPLLDTNWVIVATDKSPRQILKIKGVYKVEECGTAKLCGQEIPLFTFDEAKEALKKIDFSSRGTEDEYNEAVLAEYASLHNARKRVYESEQENVHQRRN